MGTTRRHFTRLATAGLTLAAARISSAQPIRILREERSSDGTPRPDALTRPSAELRAFVDDLTMHDMARRGAMTVVWLRGAAREPGLVVRTLEEASAAREITITERGQATVPSLVVENLGKAHVLMLAGEILLGGKQDRVVKEDVLLPPRSGPLDIEVYCVEQGRWAGRTEKFQAQGSVAAPSLRAEVSKRADQRQVWAEVDRYARAFSAPSATGSYAQVQESPAVKRQIRDAERAPELRAPADALGAAVFIDTRLLGVDAFQDAGLFGREWPKLMRAYAVEAARSPGSAPGEAPLRDKVTALLARAARADGTARRGVGAGAIFAFRLDTAHGSALVAEQRVIHLALL